MVTVGMVNHNCYGLIELAVKSILAKTDNLEKLIIVDNGSTDGSLDLLPGSPKIEIIRRTQIKHGASNGKGEGLNVVLNMMKTKFGAIVENDGFIFMNHWDTILRKFLDKNNKIIIGTEHFSRPNQVINGQFTYFMFFDNQEFQKYEINFMPKETGINFTLNNDTGWEMYSKIPENLAEKFNVLRCRYNECRIFDGPHAEYLFQNEVIFAHYGRGSYVKTKKGKDIKIFGKNISKRLRQKFKLYKFELKRWKKECLKRL